MIRFVFRFIGLWVLAAGFVALVRDGTKSIAANAFVVTSLTEDWNNFWYQHPGALGGHPSGGEVFQAQCWFRDPPSAKTTGLTNAIEFVVQP